MKGIGLHQFINLSLKDKVGNLICFGGDLPTNAVLLASPKEAQNKTNTITWKANFIDSEVKLIMCRKLLGTTNTLYFNFFKLQILLFIFFIFLIINVSHASFHYSSLFERFLFEVSNCRSFATSSIFLIISTSTENW